MENKMIVCHFDFGVKNATVMLIEDGAVTQTFTGIPQAPSEFIPEIFKLGKATGCHNIKFTKSAGEFIEFYIQQAQKYALQNYEKEDDWTFTLLEEKK